jgi:hypothetical protein
MVFGSPRLHGRSAQLKAFENEDGGSGTVYSACFMSMVASFLARFNGEARSSGGTSSRHSSEAKSRSVTVDDWSFDPRWVGSCVCA